MRRRSGFLAVVTASILLAGSVLAADEKPNVKSPEPIHPVAPGSFLKQFLTPRMSSRLTGEASAVMAFTDPTANPWTKDTTTVTRIERGAESAATAAVKQYVLESLRLDTVSVPVPSGLAGTSSPSGMKVRFGVSHFIPRADLTIPSAHGNVLFSADLRGRISTGFERHDSKLGVDLSIDPVSRDATFALGCRF